MQQMLALQQQITGTPGTSAPATSGMPPIKKSSQHGDLKEQVKRKPNVQSSQQMDYLIKPHMKKVDRRHADPLVSYASILEHILNQLRDSPHVRNCLNYIFEQSTKDS